MEEIDIKIFPKKINKDLKNIKNIIMKLKSQNKKKIGVISYMVRKWNKNFCFSMINVLIKMHVIEIKNQLVLIK